MLTYENEARQNGFRFIVGIDEAGRGPLAGPVVAAAISLKSFEFKNRVDDSKKLTSRARQAVIHEIFENAYVGIGVMNEAVIDELNVLRATHLAMSNAVRQLFGHMEKRNAGCELLPQKVILLVDGNSFLTDLPYAVKTIVRGDSRSLSIACASIVAKVYRDRLLGIYDRVYPHWGFAWHKGYPTLMHRQAIQCFGPSPIQRRTFHVSSTPVCSAV